MKKILFSVFVFFLISIQPLFASSTYVLPYPGIMPGNKMYVLTDMFDTFKKYYTFGDYANFKYYLSQSDKYLVEAKTLFEYGQYPLAQRSLEKSNKNFMYLLPLLNNSKANGRNVDEKEAIFDSAAQKHIEILQEIKDKTPESFLWEDEKNSPVNIPIRRLTEESINLRLEL